MTDTGKTQAKRKTSTEERQVSHNDTQTLKKELAFAEREVLKKKVNINGKINIICLPTPRAILAKHGILAKKTLGYGTYSKVKFCRCLYRGDIAVKIIDKNGAPENVKLLPRELRVIIKLNHPNIVRTYGHFEELGRVYVMMEYAEHGNAQGYVSENGPLKECFARTWCFQIVNAVAYLHNRGIAHRDIKMDNLVIDDGYNLKLCDFSFVKEDGLDALTRTYCGALLYSPPEILIGKPYLAKKADVWSFGVVVFTLVIGSVPFDDSGGNKSVLEEQAKMDFNWDNLTPLSYNCKSLIYSLLTYNFRERPSIDIVRRHLWFKGNMKCVPPCNTPTNDGNFEESANTEFEQNGVQDGSKFTFPGYLGIM